VVVVAGGFALTALDAQTIGPVVPTNRSASSQPIFLRVEPEPSHVGVAPFVILGGLVGAGAVTAQWIHAAVASACEKHG
jgi:hypothetical protein